MSVCAFGRVAKVLNCLPWLLVALLAGCSPGSGYRHYEGSTMGTYYRVTAACPEDVAAVIEAELRAVNEEMSTYLPESALSRFNSAAPGDWFPVPAPVVEVVDAALVLSRESQGAFDVTVGPLVNLWGFGPTEHSGVPDAEAIARARARVGYQALTTRAAPPALRKAEDRYVDLSAIAKGHGVDRVFGQLVTAGCSQLLVDIGGEVRGRGVNPKGQPWRIGVEVPDPGSSGSVQRVVLLEDAALATSGDYRNFFEAGGKRYSHTMDPRTGHPVDHALASVTVLHASTMWADGYATLLDVLGPDAGWEFAIAHDLAVLFIMRGETGFEERYTPRFEAVLAQ
jgi:thiamine biosynthesis lipoprotein